MEDRRRKNSWKRSLNPCCHILPKLPRIPRRPQIGWLPSFLSSIFLYLWHTNINRKTRHLSSDENVFQHCWILTYGKTVVFQPEYFMQIHFHHNRTGLACRAWLLRWLYTAKHIAIPYLYLIQRAASLLFKKKKEKKEALLKHLDVASVPVSLMPEWWRCEMQTCVLKCSSLQRLHRCGTEEQYSNTNNLAVLAVQSQGKMKFAMMMWLMLSEHMSPYSVLMSFCFRLVC